MTSYDVQYGDTLTSIAERLGHTGEWQALALANIDQVPDDISDEAKVYVVAERVYVGQTLEVPIEWMEREADSSSTVPVDSSMSAAQLVQLAQQASTLSELDAIDAAAAGRSTVIAAVDQRRAELLDQGATA